MNLSLTRRATYFTCLSYLQFQELNKKSAKPVFVYSTQLILEYVSSNQACNLVNTAEYKFKNIQRVLQRF